MKKVIYYISNLDYLGIMLGLIMFFSALWIVGTFGIWVASELIKSWHEYIG